MASETCFVVMAIGDQYSNGEIVTPKGELKEKYDNLIKEAILKARPHMEVVRADEVSVPGTMSTDIITRIMHSDFVIADVTIPNPNVFYELGLRHACKAGTIIIKEKSSASTPFDISHLRHIEYENTTSGLKELSRSLKDYFLHFDKKPDTPDNHFLEIAKLTSYEYPNYRQPEKKPSQGELIFSLLKDPQIFELFVKHQHGEELDPIEFMKIVMKDPGSVQAFINLMGANNLLSDDS
ncbi:hypothetical protein PAG51_25970 [Klebsiella pneumoniae]|uniref:hypothetical protein n=1 Tax=Klebsiella pneumoniae complex TaxID=3390273 RepID=UPI0007CA4D3B|nr:MULTISPECIES: hypothetical protein [Klebsiella]SAM64181.1 conserved hypothetical protein [Klebsiella quasipneumoniae subsp. similipneumoniae]MCQ8497801.1 hypothetical protein [Klebsiella pneumoniae]MDR4658481.1 hypothetical protein [Klebsiella pneumoniae]MDR4673852.1 hypothetical protein [Klebsiella pneumoniae]GKQ01371.1 hypothetical protein NUKP74_50730 [Klebsiella quasipneumoniae]